MTMEIHAQDVGTVIRITVTENDLPIDLTLASAVSLEFRRPNSTTFKVTPIVYDAVAGIIEYITVAGDISVAGKWAMQVQVTTPSGTWHSNIIDFTVYPNI